MLSLVTDYFLRFLIFLVNPVICFRERLELGCTYNRYGLILLYSLIVAYERV